MMENTVNTYEDAMDYLRIAEQAYNAGAVEEAYDIMDNVADYTCNAGSNLPDERRGPLVCEMERVTRLTHYCPEEDMWEELRYLTEKYQAPDGPSSGR